jgi:general secretion pathway protein I
MGRRQAGFTLLEAIVALVLIGSAGMALFGWINGTLLSLNRIRDANAMAEAKLNVLEYMNAVNPMLKPEGEAAFGTYRATWKAEATTAIQDNVAYPKGTGLFQLALYRTAIEIVREDGTPWFAFDLKQVGYKKVREMKLPF